MISHLGNTLEMAQKSTVKMLEAYFSNQIISATYILTLQKTEQNKSQHAAFIR